MQQGVGGHHQGAKPPGYCQAQGVEPPHVQLPAGRRGAQKGDLPGREGHYPAGQQGGKVLHAAGGSLFAGHHQDEGPARIPAQSGQQVQPLAVIQAEYPLSAGLLQGLAQLTVGLQPLQGPQQ